MNSIQFQKEITSDQLIKLYVNYNGICSNNTTNKEDIKLSIYAIDIKSHSKIFSTCLSFEDMMKLYNHLNNVALIRNSAVIHESRFIDINQDEADILSIIQNVDKKIVKCILDKADKDDKLKLVLAALTESEIQNLHASIRQSQHQKAINNLKQLLNLEQESNITDSIKKYDNLKEYVAGQPEKIFQNWIERNIWTLGIDYVKKHSVRQIGLNSEADFYGNHGRIY